ncbi:bifunctional 3-(3-hydroxy-phenyl)propionate/3-hydroxycinnamic acid hydroxylase [Saccharopolyspora sp. K220]|uniref:bifunctional 3-(3-hydroxy-phenyl)propionate/3-hydroxycinnamic acid hydroxylase MhpA n=1 Tax=Saccharopolyspora soli TaxID=2926618 RepID=UPI001F56228B|nr:bifunctional 3-(3-hydroxy-phenyl)propionate/3-hydroxycinnamic acid hydroxylase [Saccharopolyspora soli]MCI2417463.1 bifunctional 3-(3-hydroxy-phenyl)propionate/3-hydroxycinnamic acid hydroxylase [Saccharopolyspora soli]
MTARPLPVVIVGAGPTGLTAATLLAQRGFGCVVLDRWESIYPQPRAVHLDDEVYRILARLGVRDEFAAISWPCRGLRLITPEMRVLAEFARDATRGKHGYPEANMFDQQQLETVLRANLKRFATATLRGNTEVTAVAQDSGQVLVDCADRSTGARETVAAEYVLGCDGANSLVRASIETTVRDLDFAQRWLVVDVATGADLAEWEGVHQVCDPLRAATYMRIGKTRYRWEFRLAPHENADDYRDIATLHPLLSPWTKAIPQTELEIVRVAEYTFGAQIAEQWRDRRIFLLGDAAHLTPPFIGQGLGAGLRDAANLAWKLAGVLDGALPPTALDTYQVERKPHALAMIRRAKLVGTVMTEGGKIGNAIRRVVAPRLHLLPGLKDQILNSETPALHRSELVARPRFGRALDGTLCPNAVLEDGRRFDDVAASRFAVVTCDQPEETQRAEITRRGAVLLVARSGTTLHRWLRGGRARAAIVRPDGTVLRTGRELQAVCTALPDFSGTHLAQPGTEP